MWRLTTSLGVACRERMQNLENPPLNSLVKSLVFLLASAPFLISVHDRPIPTFYPELSAFLIGLAIIGSIAWRHGLSFSWVILSPLLLLGLLGFQSLFQVAPHIQDTLGFVLFIVWAVGLAAAVRSYCRNQNGAGLVDALAFGLMVGGVLNAFAAVIQVSVLVSGFPGVFYPTEISVTGNIAQRNLLASYLVIASIATIHLSATRRLPTAVMVPILLSLSLALSISTARSMLVYTGWMALSVLVLRRFAGDEGRNRGVLFFVASLMLWQLLQPWLAEILPGLGETSLAERFRSQGLFDGLRTSMLAVAWQMFAEHPWLGAGLGSFDQWVFWRELPAGSAPLYLSNVEHGHNIVAHLAGELGLLAPIPLIVMLLAGFRGKPCEPSANWLALAALGVLILHSLLEYPLWYMHFLALFAVLLAIRLPDVGWHTGTGRLQAIIALVLTGSLALLAVPVVRDFQRMSTTALPPTQLFNVFAEISRNPLIGQHARGFMAANINPAPNRIPYKLALCQQAIGEYADDLVIYNCLPIYDLAGRREEAQQFRNRLSRNVLSQFREAEMASKANAGKR